MKSVKKPPKNAGKALNIDVTDAENADSPRTYLPQPAEKRTFRDLVGEHRMEMINEAKELSRAGLTEHEMAAYFDVNVTTFRMWKARDKSFQAACQHFHDIATSRVTASLYDRAVGYYYDVEDIRVIKDKVVRIQTRKYVEPNIAAIIFWLKNRAPAEWRDVSEHKLEANVESTIKSEAVNDPRKLAMAMLSVMREAADKAHKEANAPSIEHDENEA